MSAAPLEYSYSPITESKYHHGSHRHLLSRPQQSPTVDAIVVPTARSSASLHYAIETASQLNCTLIALCSKNASAATSAQLAQSCGVEMISIDVNTMPSDLIPHFDTTELLNGTGFQPDTDTSLKRNLGLLLTNFIGYKRIVFLDDDIRVPQPYDLHDAARLLDLYSAVGLTVAGFPDNSVVSHAYREVGGAQDTFIGGGALAINPTSIRSFFPTIYNEDWFFLLDGARLRPSAAIGTVVQEPYDPFSHVQRAQNQEFGDSLAEGLFRLLDGGRSILDADIAYWRYFLENRLLFIEEIIEKLTFVHEQTSETTRVLAALNAAHEQCQLIKPSLCTEYLHTWRRDTSRWQRHINKSRIKKIALPKKSTPENALAELGLTNCSSYIARPSEHSYRTQSIISL